MSSFISVRTNIFIITSMFEIKEHLKRKMQENKILSQASKSTAVSRPEMCDDLGAEK